MDNKELTEIMSGKRLKISEARNGLPTLVKQVREKRATIIERSGEAVAAIISIDTLREVLTKAEAYEIGEQLRQRHLEPTLERVEFINRLRSNLSKADTAA